MLMTVVSTHLYCFSCVALAAIDCFSAASLSGVCAKSPCGTTSAMSSGMMDVHECTRLRVMGNLPL